MQDPFADAAQFLSGGNTAAKWPTIGFVVEGTVKSAAMQQQKDYDTGELMFWNDGKPRMQLEIDLQCEPTGVTWKGLRNVQTPVPNDDGMRTAYVKGNLQKALSKAITAAQAKFEAGARVRIERIADVPNADPKKQPALDFSVTWIPAAQNGAVVDDFLSAPTPEAAPAPVQAPYTQPPANLAAGPVLPPNPFAAPAPKEPPF